MLLGVHDAGKPASPVELAAALRIVLDDPEAGARWMRGEPVFASATNALDAPQIAYCTACHKPVEARGDAEARCGACGSANVARGIAALAVAQRTLIPSISTVRERPEIGAEIGLMLTAVDRAKSN